MRWLVLTCFALLTWSAWADGPQCAAIPQPIPVNVGVAGLEPTQPTKSDAATASQRRTEADADPNSLAGLPFVRHVAVSGAGIIEIGMMHGLHLVAARHGDEFRIFSILPSGDAAIEGAPVALSASQLERIAAGQITPLPPEAGFTGYFVRSGGSFQVFYATPDGLALVPGVLRDAAGKNLTRAQVANIPGAIPTVEVTTGTQGQPGGAAGPAASLLPTMLAMVEKAEYGTLGPDAALQLFILIDPQCIYSVRAFQELRGYAQAGKIRLAVVPLSVLDYEDHGQSTRSALALLSKPANQIVAAWQAGEVAGRPSPDASAKLQKNMAIAEGIGLKGTPTFLRRQKDGSVGRVDGMPPDIAALVSSAGS